MPVDRARTPVLVLDADQTSSLAVVRALGRAGIPVEVGSAKPDPLGASSRHVRQAHRHPDPLTQEAAFIDWVRQRQTQQRSELIFPLTERSVVPLTRHRSGLDDTRLALAPSRALEQVLDKSKTVALAESLGLRVPRSHHVATAAALDGFVAAQPWGFPLVVKPMRSFGHDGKDRVQLAVSYAFNPTQLRQLVLEALRYGEVILQEYFVGQGVGVELIADRGEVRYAFQHRRLHEVPLTGGGSSLRISEAVVPALQDASAKLIKALNWHGVAMVEFKYQPETGDHCLMEINGRFWGSLPLAVAAGANFPVMLHELMTLGRVSDWPAARPGVLCRQLARDIDWLEHVLRKHAPPELVTLPTKAQILRDWAQVFSPRHHFDAQSLSDPWPGLVDIGRLLRQQGERLTGLWRQRQRLRQEWLAARAQHRRGAQSGGPKPQQILFLCYGNINRSALAEAWAQARLSPGLRVASAGFHATDGRPADPVMVSVASEAGADLHHWKSHTLSAEQVQRSDLILAMEVAHLDRLLQAHPQARGKAFLLGAVTASHAAAAEIPDPYGRPRDTYQRVCRQVTRAVDAWLEPWRTA